MYKVNELNNVINTAQRRMVLIEDPHISNSSDYPVYTNGVYLQ
jgi:hypothetical protein